MVFLSHWYATLPILIVWPQWGGLPMSWCKSEVPSRGTPSCGVQHKVVGSGSLLCIACSELSTRIFPSEPWEKNQAGGGTGSRRASFPRIIVMEKPCQAR